MGFIKWSLLLVISVSCYSQKLSDPFLHNAIMKGIDETLKQDYLTAQITFQSIIQHYPDHPSGYLYLAGMLQAEYSDYGRMFDEAQYDSLLMLGEYYAGTMISNGKEKDWGYYYAGCTEAYRSFTAAEGGNLPSGIIHGIKAADKLELCLESNSEFYAAMNILGSYYYWRSTMSWIPFLKNRKDEGIRLVKKAVEMNEYEHILGKNNLVSIYIEEKYYSEAEKIAKEVLEKYPNNRNFLWMLMTVCEKTGNHKANRIVVGKLLQSIVSAPVINYYKEATCRVKLAQYAFEDKRYSSVLDETNKVITLKIYVDKVAGDLNKKIKIAESLARDVKMQMNKN
jgi:tetratricopeptide (TPR) repeat protein